MSQPARIATTVLASAAVLAGSYAIYFDYQRRNNPEFRKQIRMSPPSKPPQFKMETNEPGLQKKKAQAQEEGAKKELKARLDKVRPIA
jgi:import receptor subunit TOM20